MVTYYAPPTFPFSKLFPLGIVLIVFGVISLALGVVDLVYTQLKYDLNTCDNANFIEWQCPNRPCDNPSIPWALVAPGIWVGFFVMIAGGVTTSLMYATGSSIKSKRDSSGVLAGLVAFPLGPVLIVITGLRLYYMNSYFFCINSADNQFIIADYLEFLMPLLTGFTVFLAWSLSLSVVVSLCRRGRLSTRDDFEYEYGRRYREPEEYARDYAESPRSRPRRPFMVPDMHDYKYYSAERERPRYIPWRDRALMGWREPTPYTISRPYPSGARSDPYPSFRRESPRPRRGYFTTKTYNRY